LRVKAEMAENASETRPRGENGHRHDGVKRAGTPNRAKTLEESKTEMLKIIASALESGQRDLGNQEGWRRVAKLLEKIQAEANGLTRDKSAEERSRKDNKMEEIGGFLNRLDERLDRLERNGVERGQGLNPKAKGRKPLWSEVAAPGGKTTVQIRMTEMEGAESESNGQRLEKIRDAIPGAKALIPHPRASDKVTVVVTPAIKESLERNGLKEGTEGMRLIRRPIQVMILGVPFTEPITSKNSTANMEWLKANAKVNGVSMGRVEWMYPQKRVEELVKAGKKRGSVIVDVATEADRATLIQEGMVIGPEWFRVVAWDIAMKETQCFRCWGWGHTQSVCNSPREMCGKCAGAHCTKECAVKSTEEARCAACKTKGHFAFWKRTCSAYTKFKVEREATRTQLEEITARIYRDQSTRSSSAFSFSRSAGVSTTSSQGWTTVSSKRPSGSKSRRTENDNGDEERFNYATPGRPRDITRAARAAGQTKIRLDPIVINGTPQPEMENENESS
jgi:hypothetical protein